MMIKKYYGPKKFLFLILFIGFSLLTTDISYAQTGHTLTLVNNCSESVYIGMFNGAPSVPLLCTTSTTGPTTGDCGPQGGQGSTIANNPSWVGPPPWGTNGSPTWEIPPKASDPENTGTRILSVPNCYNGSVMVFRTGCVVNSSGGLDCKAADCGGMLNCGTNGVGAKSSSVAEFTFDGGTPASCDGSDNYDVSFVSGFHVLLTIEPDTPPQSGGVNLCGKAGGRCTGVPACPWTEYIFDPTSTSNINGFVACSNCGDIPTCLSPTKMAAFNLPPFTGFSQDDTDKLGCVGNYVNTPWTTGVCMTSFGNNPNSCALDASMNCSTNTNIPPEGNSTPPCCDVPATMCDPYGQCDSNLNRSAAWPQNNNNQNSTDYIVNIHNTCGDNSQGTTGGVYAWQFDDGNQVLGLSAGDYSCTKPGGTSGSNGVNYTINICSASDKDNDSLTNSVDIDADNDGIPNTNENSAQNTSSKKIIGIDIDDDGIPNALDLDSDGDGIPDHIEGGGTNDANRDGLADNFVDSDADGHHDEHDVDQTANILPLPDTDQDGTPDFIDTDSDNDGVSDTNETTGMDVDGDGRLDDSEDLNNDGIADSVHPDSGSPLVFIDTDEDGIFNHLDPSDGLTAQDGDGCSLALNGSGKLSLFWLLIPAVLILRGLIRKK